jgi:uncharacterized membrane protein YpjA
MVYRLYHDGVLSEATWKIHNDVVDYANGYMSEDVSTKLEALFAVSDDTGLSVALVRQHCVLAATVADACIAAQRLSRSLPDCG